MHSIDDVRKSLKVTGIIDVICAVVFFALAIVMIVVAVGAVSSVGGEGEEYQAGEVTLTILMVLISAMIWIVAIVLFILFAISLGFGINSLKVSKKDLDIMKKKRGGLIAGAVFGVIGCLLFAVLLIASIAAVAQDPATGVIPVVVAVLALVIVLLSTVFKIRSASILKNV
ncbi:MAG: hypothetical protein MJ068_04960 [Clostridia bacterium]|nr:hypothetical protein [Clostridia bacterium]